LKSKGLLKPSRWKGKKQKAKARSPFWKKMSSASIGTICLPRYLRIRPVSHSSTDSSLKNANSAFCLSLLHGHFGEKVMLVPWLTNFIAIPGYRGVASARSDLINGGLFSMDASSELAVLALDIENARKEDGTPIRVLDMCCAPGGKLLSLFDRMREGDCLDGVDASEHRTELCRSIITKHFDAFPDHARDGPNLRLYLTDGASFGTSSPSSPPPALSSVSSSSSAVAKAVSAKSGVYSGLFFDSGVYLEELLHRGSRKKMNKSAKARQRKRLKTIGFGEATSAVVSDDADVNLVDGDKRGISSSSSASASASDSSFLYDRVLVDAECTHDGSYRHMKYVDEEEKDKDTELLTQTKAVTASTKYLDEERHLNITDLQRRLLDNGFARLRSGGTLVYSTCSLEHRQNEDIVNWLLNKYPDNAILVPLHDFIHTSPAATEVSQAIISELDKIELVFKAQEKTQELDSDGETLQISSEEFQTQVHHISDTVLTKVCATGNTSPLGFSDTLPGTVRFDRRSGTSGLYIAKITKR